MSQSSAILINRIRLVGCAVLIPERVYWPNVASKLTLTYIRLNLQATLVRCQIALRVSQSLINSTSVPEPRCLSIDGVFGFGPSCKARTVLVLTRTVHDADRFDLMKRFAMVRMLFIPTFYNST